MKIVVLDGYAANPGDLCWDELEMLGECAIYDRTAPEEVLERRRSRNPADQQDSLDSRTHGCTA